MSDQRKLSTVDETLKHQIIECRHHVKEREVFEKTIIEKLGEREWIEIKRENQEIPYILGLIAENQLNMEDTKKYLGEIWKKERKEVEIVEEGEEVEHKYYRKLKEQTIVISYNPYFQTFHFILRYFFLSLFHMFSVHFVKFYGALRC